MNLLANKKNKKESNIYMHIYVLSCIIFPFSHILVLVYICIYICINIYIYIYVFFNIYLSISLFLDFILYECLMFAVY